LWKSEHTKRSAAFGNEIRDTTNSCQHVLIFFSSLA
jgi:hypothetical protein